MTPESLVAYLSAANRLVAQNRIVYSDVASTNEVGKRIAAHLLLVEATLSSCIVLALRQTVGRGRLGRRWQSPSGGIYASYVWFCAKDQLQLLPLRIAVALRRSLAELTDIDCRLKWPNDLMVDHRKVGGILIETLTGRPVIGAVVGFGINYLGFSDGYAERAATVSEISASCPAYAAAVLGLLGAVEEELVTLRPAHEIVTEYADWSTHRVGDAIRCRTIQGVVHGRFAGFDDLGRLRLKTATGETLMSSGDILEARVGERDEQ